MGFAAVTCLSCKARRFNNEKGAVKSENDSQASASVYTPGNRRGWGARTPTSMRFSPCWPRDASPATRAPVRLVSSI